MLGAHTDLTSIMNSMEEINKYKKLEKYNQLIDNYVITSTTDLNGIITSASEAFCRISAYKKNETNWKIT